MKRVRCPKCDNYITFDEKHYIEGQQLVFECPECHKQFAIRIGVSKLHATHKEEKLDEQENAEECGSIVVVENVFHYKQVIPLRMGDNVIGRYVRGTDINTPIETVDPSVDTKHCIIRVQRNKRGDLQYILRDAPSNTGTFYMNDILRDQDRVRLSEGSIITIGATTLILRTAQAADESS
ncbi:MAG: FHA domain-containing protein [Bacteroidaceae bacterium]|nr:FHA domain-containing protein [Bacteroidaceae bacterium]MBR1788763.1 FHA domain-containing protein [Bacteroidaceae bacterium]